MARVKLLMHLLTICLLAAKPTTAPPQCPSVCYCDSALRYVSCISDGMDSVPTDIPKTVMILELRSYNLGVIANRQINTLHRLTELKLQQNGISAIEDGSFSQLMKLQRLELRANELTRLTSSTFMGQMSLVHLDLSKNNIKTLERAFLDLISLKQLNLGGNFVPSLEQDTLIGLASVQYLNLDTNNISRIHVGTFKYLTRLVQLIISNNPIVTLDRLDFYGTGLQYVDLSKTGLMNVPKSMSRHMQTLRLTRNNISDIQSSDFDAYPNLRSLTLDGNKIRLLKPNTLGQHKLLSTLSINGNKLVKIPDGLPPNLLTLNLERNLIFEINNDALKHLPKLQQLSLEVNIVITINEISFRGIDDLTNLNLQSNLIESIAPRSFWNITKLKVLNLSQNNIKSLSGELFKRFNDLQVLKLAQIPGDVEIDENTFEGLTGLKSLTMQSSPILLEKILASTKLLEGLRNVYELNILNNGLATIRSDLPTYLPNLNAIALGGNNWRCDSSILWLVKWMKYNTIHFFQKNSIRCAMPRWLRSTLIMNLREEMFRTTPTDLPFPQTPNSKIWFQITQPPQARRPHKLAMKGGKLNQHVPITVKPYFENLESTRIRKIRSTTLHYKTTEKMSSAKPTPSASTTKQEAVEAISTTQVTEITASPNQTTTNVKSSISTTEKTRTSALPIETLNTSTSLVARSSAMPINKQQLQLQDHGKDASIATLLGLTFAACTILMAIVTIITCLVVRKRQKTETRQRTGTWPLLLNAGLSRQNSLNQKPNSKMFVSAPAEIPQASFHEASNRLKPKVWQEASLDDQVALVT